jgi:hypothetical protein
VWGVHKKNQVKIRSLGGGLRRIRLFTTFLGGMHLVGRGLASVGMWWAEWCGHLVGRARAPSRGLTSVGMWWAESWLWASGGQGVRALTRAC